MMRHVAQAGDLVRIEFLLGRHLQFFTYGVVMASGEEVIVEAIYLADVPVQFDTIAIPADQLAPHTDTVLVDYGYTRLNPGESFDFTGVLDVTPPS